MLVRLLFKPRQKWPRVQALSPRRESRDYFPETLVWMPELLTDERGIASAQFALADTVTTWKLAVFASTLDGRAAEYGGRSACVRSRSSLDFNPAPVLTEGDRMEVPVAVRNYLAQSQKVDIAIEPNDWSTSQGPTKKQIAVMANNSANISFAVQANRSTEKGPQRVVANARAMARRH